MEKRHRRVLSKPVVSDPCFGFLGLVLFRVFDSELKRAGGRAASPQLAPPCGRMWKDSHGRGDRGEGWCWELFTKAVKSALAVFPADLSNRTGQDFRSARAIADGS